MAKPAATACAAWVIPLILLGACSAKQVYDSGQGLRQDECRKIVDEHERQRCIESANASYEEYRRRQGQGR